ncbi:MAG: CDP-alcohol phosphatidyltransferase family protein [Hyphomicrobiaceae bacterium]
MIARLGAASVHLLTASGAVLALLALGAVHRGDWHMMFVWLGAALVIDAVDGPLARALKIETLLPHVSGERLDLIVDYLTYVVVPAVALTEATLLPEAARLPAAAFILLSGLFHVAALTSKTEEGYFVGFPAIWNIVLLYLFALEPAPAVSLAIVALFVLLTFVPLLAVHPFRVVRLRPLTCVVTALWAVTAAFAVANPFPSPLWIQVLLVSTAIYLACIGLFRHKAEKERAP